MNRLAIETATENCSVALQVDGTGNPAVLEAVTPAGHSKLVHGMIASLLARHNLRHQDIDQVIVDHGPGSFTGVRIGLGVAQGIAYAANAKCLTISSLAALATNGSAGLCISAIDARMQQVYCALYQCASTDDAPRLLCGPFVCAPEQVGALIVDSVATGLISEATSMVGTGTGWGTYGQQLSASVANALGDVDLSIDGARLPGALDLLSLVSDDDVAVSPLALTALYVRNEIAKKTAAGD